MAKGILDANTIIRRDFVPNSSWVIQWNAGSERSPGNALAKGSLKKYRSWQVAKFPL
jgi:hypothetical protein